MVVATWIGVGDWDRLRLLGRPLLEDTLGVFVRAGVTVDVGFWTSGDGCCRRPRRALAALLMLVVALGLLLVGNRGVSLAQSAQVLVSNLGQALDDHASLGNTSDLAQQFKIGSYATTLTSIDLSLRSEATGHCPSQGDAPQRLRNWDESG